MNPDTPYLPLLFNLAGKPCLIVGGGAVAWRKILDLLSTEADLTIVAPEAIPPIREAAAAGRCRWWPRGYQSPEAQEYHLVIATTNDPMVNREVYEDCQARAIPVNVVDQPSLCSVIFPAVTRRGIVTAAVATGGQAPFLAHYLREQMEEFLDDIPALRHPDLIVQFRQFAKRRARDAEHESRLYRRLLTADPQKWEIWSAQESPENLWEVWLQEEDE